MLGFMHGAFWLMLAHIVLVLGFCSRVFLRNDLVADVRMAWSMVIVLFPVFGCLLYFLFGEADLGERFAKRYREVSRTIERTVTERLSKGYLGIADNLAFIDPLYQEPFRYLASMGFNPVGGNRAELMADGDEARARIIEDIDAATDQVNVLYYIWLHDTTGLDVANALIRAAKRGVTCRAMVDGLGSRALLKQPIWKAMQEAGVQTAVALPINNPLVTMFTSRLDLRNHRKITLIDGKVTYCGSQNCADEEFMVKARFAPWVDIMLRMQGPVVTQMQLLFASDWMIATGEGLSDFITQTELYPEGFTAQVMGDGPAQRRRSTAQFLVNLINCARNNLTISTPYFVPDPTVLEALCAAGWRGVRVRLIFPKRNDSWVVAAASRSHYLSLVEAGVEIHEFTGGLLHAKTLTVDDSITFIGSTNLDLRSFDLNFENNVLLQDKALTQQIMARQAFYLTSAHQVNAEEVRQWSYPRRIWHNAWATVGPLL